MTFSQHAGNIQRIETIYSHAVYCQVEMRASRILLLHFKQHHSIRSNGLSMSIFIKNFFHLLATMCTYSAGLMCSFSGWNSEFLVEMSRCHHDSMLIAVRKYFVNFISNCLFDCKTKCTRTAAAHHHPHSGAEFQPDLCGYSFLADRERTVAFQLQ